MSYRINHYNGSLIATVADGTIDNSLDITLVGKNYAGYGKTQNDNFVFLLENFAGSNPPAAPISGQIWYDSGNRKLKFYDGTKFKTSGNTEISATEPTGLAVGDFWFDTVNNQLHAYTGTGFALIGPQMVAGSGATEMLSTSVLDDTNTPHTIIQAINNGETVFIISSDSTEFTLNPNTNTIPGFEVIHKGVTLAYTYDTQNLGETTSDHRFWGTASNADRLNGLSADSFVLSDSGSFGRIVNFSDDGYTVGNPVSYLWVYIDSTNVPNYSNIFGDEQKFNVTIDSITQTSLKVKGLALIPGDTEKSSVGTADAPFKNMYATTLTGTATQANTLKVGSTTTYVGSSTAATASTVAVRDSSGDLFAAEFRGTATKAKYADLAENYLADAEYPVGTVMMIGGEKEVTACVWGKRAIGVVSEKPAYLMNDGLQGGTAVALKGRVPVKVHGSVKKGDELIASDNGCAVSAVPHANGVFAVALESSDETGVRLVECLVL